MKINPHKKTCIQRLPDSNTRFLSYDETYMLTKKYEQRLCQEHFDLVIAVARSGVIPAVIIAQMCDLPLRCSYTTRVSDSVSIDPGIQLDGKKILIVEDIIGRGHTVKKVYDFLTSHGAMCKVFTLFYDENTSEYLPDFGMATSYFIQPLWDRKNNTPIAKSNLEKYNGATLDSPHECVGIDLDSVCLPKTNCHSNKSEQLKYILKYKDKFLPTEIVPMITNQKQLHILTGKPISDFLSTTAWLKKNKLEHIQLLCCNSDNNGPSHHEMADFLAAKIIEIGISRFYESDLLQAMLVSEKVPVCDIIWFKSQQQILIKATVLQMNTR